jgi:hypothetical protein
MIRKFVLAGAAVAVAASVAGTAFAGAADYAFEPVKAEVKSGNEATVAVRLVHKPSGKPVTDAVIVQTRLDMAPENGPARVLQEKPRAGRRRGPNAYFNQYGRAPFRCQRFDRDARRRLAGGRTDGGIVVQNNFSRDEGCCSLSTTTWSAPLQRTVGRCWAARQASTSEHMGLGALGGRTVRASTGESASWAHDVQPSVI